jgi:hypothetical protein
MLIWQLTQERIRRGSFAPGALIERISDYIVGTNQNLMRLCLGFRTKSWQKQLKLLA